MLTLSSDDEVLFGSATSLDKVQGSAKQPKLESLYGTSWLDDEVIDRLCSAVATPAVAPFLVFWRIAVDKTCLDCTSDDLHQSLLRKTIWLLPYNRAWALFVVLWRARRIVHLDSMHGQPAAEDLTAVQQLMQTVDPLLNWKPGSL